MQNFTFSLGPQLFLLFWFSHANLFNWKKDLKWKNLRGPFSPWPAHLGADPDPSSRASRPASHYRSTIADRRGPPINPLFPPNPPSSARSCGNAGQTADDGPTTHHHPSVMRMPMCPPTALSHRVGCGASWHPITATRLHLSSSTLRQSDSGANRSVTRPRAGCFTSGQLLPRLCAPLGHPVPSLTEASRRPAAPVDRCDGRCATTMSRQELSDNASHNASASSFLADTACGPSSLQLPSPAPRRSHALACPCTPRGPIQRHPPIQLTTPTPTYGQNSFGVVSMQIPCHCPPRCTPVPARARSHCSTTAER
jgi:hypothetical protein